MALKVTFRSLIYEYSIYWTLMQKYLMTTYFLSDLSMCIFIILSVNQEHISSIF